MRSCRYFRLSAQRGLTLLEMLVAAALTTTILLSAGSVLFAIMRTEHGLLRQTDQFDSMRVASSIIVEDIRRSVEATCASSPPPPFLQLSTTADGTSYIKYQFRRGDGTDDPNHLHRLVYQSGVLTSDDIVGWDLVPAGQPGGTTFGCQTYPEYKRATVVLAKPQLRGQVRQTRMEITAFLR